MTPVVLMEDEYLLVLAKPTGWVTNSADTVRDVPILQKWVHENITSEIAKDSEFRSGIVHRLDKDTSGVIVVAKTKEVYWKLQDMFRERLVEKTYMTLVHGKVPSGNGTIDAPIGRLPWNRERFGVFPGGRSSTTYYEVVNQYEGTKKNDFYSLLDVHPKTGRTHQIRVHMKSIGHPVVSDIFYAGRKTSRSDLTWCPRLFLHASKISFLHPITKERLEVENPLPDDLNTALGKITKIINKN